MYNQQRTFGWAIMPHAGTGPVDEGEVLHYWNRDQGPAKLARWYSRCGLTVTEAPLVDKEGAVVVYPRRCKRCQWSSMCRGQTPMMRGHPCRSMGQGAAVAKAKPQEGPGRTGSTRGFDAKGRDALPVLAAIAAVALYPFGAVPQPGPPP